MSGELGARSSERQPMLQTELGHLARAFANDVWNVVIAWPRFPQDTMGRQLVRCADSVGANLVEGDGRGSESDAIRFFGYSRSSLREAEYFLVLSADRALIDPEIISHLRAQIDGLVKRINGLIKYRRSSSVSVVREHRGIGSGRGLSHDLRDPRLYASDDTFEYSETPSEL